MPRRSSLPSPTLNAPVLRGKIWVETQGIALTDAGADLLEQIEATGSLSEAARRLRFSYRRAWMLADAMNTRWPGGALIHTAVGGRKGGGTRLTPLGRSVLAAYRDLQIQFEALLDHATTPFRHSTRAERH